MKTLVNIFAFYLFMLAALPPLQGCAQTDETGTMTNCAQNEIAGNGHTTLCSPFCGEDNCGIMIDFQMIAPPVITYPELQILRPVFKENLMSITHSSLWHPPQA